MAEQDFFVGMEEHKKLTGLFVKEKKQQTDFLFDFLWGCSFLQLLDLPPGFMATMEQ